MNLVHLINKFCLAAWTHCGEADWENRAEQRSSVCTCSGTGEPQTQATDCSAEARHNAAPYVPLSSDKTQSLQLTLSNTAIVHLRDW